MGSILAWENLAQGCGSALLLEKSNAFVVFTSNYRIQVVVPRD
jgi:hypothetical protein